MNIRKNSIESQIIKPVKGETNKKGRVNLFDLTKQTVQELNIPFYDSCCTAENYWPTRYNSLLSRFERYNGTTWVEVPTPVESGTYTPTITNDANAQNISTDGPWQYMRVGNVVTVSGNFNVEAIAAAGTQTTVFFNPPIFSDFPIGVEAGGTAWGTVSMINGGQVTMTFSNTLQCKWFAAANGAADYVAIHFTYLIVEAP